MESIFYNNFNVNGSVPPDFNNGESGIVDFIGVRDKIVDVIAMRAMMRVETTAPTVHNIIFVDFFITVISDFSSIR